MPDRARIYYNLGLLQQYLQEFDDAETSMKKALTLEPDNMDFLYAMADFYIKRGELGNARKYALEMKEKYPQSLVGQNLIDHIGNL